MIAITRFLYNYLLLPLFISALYSLSFFNDKVKRGFKEREVEQNELSDKVNALDKRRKNIWFHSSSLGEFEQAKPIIEKLWNEENVNIIVTFFSPSGYENSVKYPYANVVTYIPLDTKARCKNFVETIKPDTVVFMRYDIWPNMVFELSEKEIPILLVDATMRKGSPRKIGFSNKFHSHIYKKINKILTVSEEDRKNFLEFDLDENKAVTVGDTRFDRVYQKSIVAKDKKLFSENIFKNKKVIVLGSSWPSDEEVILPALLKIMTKSPEVILIIAPHEPTIQHLEKLEGQISRELDTIRFSYMNNYQNQRVILINSIGILLSLYYYADIAYVGGGFKQGIHNVLEPAVYGIPVLFGPKFQNSQEAFSIIEEGSARVIHTKKEAYRILKKLFDDDDYRKNLGNISAQYVKKNTGATAKIFEEIISCL